MGSRILFYTITEEQPWINSEEIEKLIENGVYQRDLFEDLR